MAGGPVVLVLASGRGERFRASGGAGSKLQALLAGRPVLQHTVAAARASGLRVHVEDAGHPGMGDSIAAAVNATRDADGWLVLPGDLPLVRAQTLRAVAQEAFAGAAHPRTAVLVPTYQGVRGHPVAFSRDCVDELLALSGPEGASSIVKHWTAQGRVMQLEIGDPGVVTDVDSLEDLARAEAILRARGS